MQSPPPWKASRSCQPMSEKLASLPRLTSSVEQSSKNELSPPLCRSRIEAASDLSPKIPRPLLCPVRAKRWMHVHRHVCGWTFRRSHGVTVSPGRWVDGVGVALAASFSVLKKEAASFDGTTSQPNREHIPCSNDTDSTLPFLFPPSSIRFAHHGRRIFFSQNHINKDLVWPSLA